MQRHLKQRGLIGVDLWLSHFLENLRCHSTHEHTNTPMSLFRVAMGARQASLFRVRLLCTATTSINPPDVSLSCAAGSKDGGKFRTMGLHSELSDAMLKLGFIEPTQIQDKTFKTLLRGSSAVISAVVSRSLFDLDSRAPLGADQQTH
jgi:hypothetical protein